MPTRPRNARNTKKNRNLNSGFESSTDSTPLDSPALSPPTQLPTPLPEVEDLMPHHPHEERLDVRGEPTGLGFIVPPQDAQPRLIDFEFDDDDEQPTYLSMMPTPEQPSSRPPFIANDDPHQHSVYPITERGDDPDDDIHAATGMYRSPPFIEAQLPAEEEDDDDEEAPLPIPPRIFGEERRFGVERRGVDTVDHGFAGFSPIGGGGGHVRSPTIPSRTLSNTSPPVLSPTTHSRSQSQTYSVSALAHSRSPSRPTAALASASTSTSGSGALDSLSRTLRSYSPFPVPSPTDSTPSRRRPSQDYAAPRTEERGRDTRDRRTQEFEREYEREDEDLGGGGGYGYGYGHSARSPPPSAGLGSLKEGPAASTATSTMPMTATTTSGLTERLRSPRQRSQSRQRRGEDVEGQQQDRKRKSIVGGDEIDRVVWARWDRLRGGGGKGSPLLILGYASGFQIWDVSNLASVTEVLNIKIDTGSTVDQEWSEGRVERVASVVVIPQEASMEGRKSLGETVRVGEDERETLLGVLLETGPSSSDSNADSTTTVAIYSLRSHRVVERLSFGGVPNSLECSERFIVVSTSSPAALHVISASSFEQVYTIPASSLATFTTPRPTTYTSSGLQVPSYLSSAYSSASSASSTQVPIASSGLQDTQGGRAESVNDLPHPVFALSHRLLAYAVPSSSSSPSSGQPGVLQRKDSSGSSQGSVPSPSNQSPSPFTGMNLPKIPTTQAELGSAALKVGGTVFSGMKFLGGIALEAAKNRINNSMDSTASSPTTGAPGRVGADGSTQGGVRGFFSRSAPSGGGGVVSTIDGEEERKRRRFSGMSGGAGGDTQDVRQQKGSVSPNTTRPRLERGYAVIVVDLDTLLPLTPGDARSGDGEAGVKQQRPRVVVEFIGSRSQPIANLAWSEDGAEVLVVPRDGYLTKVFRVRPSPAPLKKDVDSSDAPPSKATANAASSSAANSASNATNVLGSVVQLYELRRGRTTAVVEDVKVVGDGRWTGVLTKNRTVHVFATNPLGGRPHHASHLAGRVRNVDPVPFKMIDLPPLVRLRGSRIAINEDDMTLPALAFTFIEPSEVALPFSLSPSRSATCPTVPIDPTSSPPLSSPRHPRAPKNYQDVLMFDCATAALSLHRLTVEQKQKDTGIVSAALSGTSLSLPGMGGAGPLQSVSSSLSSNSGLGRMSNASGSKMQQPPQRSVEEQYDLVGKTNVVATWDLKKRKDWDEIRVLGTREGDLGGASVGAKNRVGADKSGGSDEWLAQAELLTGPKFRTARTRSIYLSHQFSFNTLGEDYHGLVRQYRLDVSGTKIDVRKDVPIQAFTTGSSGPSSNTGAAESFVEGFSPPNRMRGQFNVSSSFDEPLASALAGELDYQPPTAVLPMYPNGVPGASSRSLRNSIPIRKMAGLGDGVSEGLGRIRSQMGRVRSPKLGPRASGDWDMHGDVLLEFDEEVDDFMAPRAVDPTMPRRNADNGMDDDVVGKVDEEIWDGGWDNQDRQAVEEEEQFHAISTAQYASDDLAATDSTTSAHAGVLAVSPPIKAKKKTKRK